MCFASQPKIPETPPTPPPAPTATTIYEDQSTAQARDAERQRAAQATGRQSTLLTGGSGLSTPAPTERKTLLGQ